MQHKNIVTQAPKQVNTAPQAIGQCSGGPCAQDSGVEGNLGGHDPRTGACPCVQVKETRRPQ